jgi:hypothetical protein
MTLVCCRVLKYTSLTKNLTSMMASVLNLYREPAYRPSFTTDVENLACRLTWIMLYFYRAMSNYSSWIFGQTQVQSMAQMNGPDWITFLQAFTDSFMYRIISHISLVRAINSFSSISPCSKIEFSDREKY